MAVWYWRQPRYWRRSSGSPPPLARSVAAKTNPGRGRSPPFGQIPSPEAVSRQQRPRRISPGPHRCLVGEPRFELGASSSRTKRATVLRHSPIFSDGRKPAVQCRYFFSICQIELSGHACSNINLSVPNEARYQTASVSHLGRVTTTSKVSPGPRLTRRRTASPGSCLRTPAWSS